MEKIQYCVVNTGTNLSSNGQWHAEGVFIIERKYTYGSGDK